MYEYGYSSKSADNGVGTMGNGPKKILGKGWSWSVVYEPWLKLLSIASLTNRNLHAEIAESLHH